VGKCISYEKCVAMKNPNIWKVFEKVEGEGSGVPQPQPESAPQPSPTPSQKQTSTEETTSQAPVATTSSTQAPDPTTRTMIVRAALTVFAENFRKADDESFIDSLEESLALQLGIDKSQVQVTHFEHSGGRRLRNALPRRLATTKITARFEVMPAEPGQFEATKIAANLEAPGFVKGFKNNLVDVQSRKGSSVIIEAVDVSAPEVATVASSDKTTQGATQSPMTPANAGGTTTPESREKIITSTPVSPVSGEQTSNHKKGINGTLRNITSQACAENSTVTEMLCDLAADRAMMPSVVVSVLLTVMSSTSSMI